jgi:hypothetical protein
MRTFQVAIWEDACAVWLHNSSTILGWAALGKAEKTMKQLTNKTADWLKLSKYLSNFGK